MTTRAMGPAAGWSWLKQAINLGSHNPKAVFGAAALFLAVALVPTLLQIFVQNGLGLTDPGAMMALLAFSCLYTLLVMPPLIAGFLRIIHATESGVAARPGDIFEVFRSGGAIRFIGLFLLLVALVIVIFGVLGAAFGADFFNQIGAVFIALQAATPGTTPTLPSMPDGIGMFVALLMLLGTFFNAVYAISFGQAALTTRSVLGAFGDGVMGALKNALPLLVLLLIAIVLGIAALLILVLLMALLAMIGGLVHPVLGMLLAAPVYLAAMLVIYVISFGVMYFMWRDICGDAATPAVPVAAGNQVEL